MTSVSNLGSSNLLVKKQLFQKVGGFDDKMMSCEDYDISQRLLKYGELVIVENVRVTHLRESKTLLELFKREVTRGRYSLRCYIKNGYRLREMPSLLIPCVDIICKLAVIIALSNGNYGLTKVFALLIAFMPFIYLIRRIDVNHSLEIMLYGYLVAFTYISARSTALLKEISDIITYQIKHEA